MVMSEYVFKAHAHTDTPTNKILRRGRANEEGTKKGITKSKTTTTTAINTEAEPNRPMIAEVRYCRPSEDTANKSKKEGDKTHK